MLNHLYDWKRKETQILLAMMLPDPINQEQWINGYNTYFGMTPKKMIEDGREIEVMRYLYYAVYGPY